MKKNIILAIFVFCLPALSGKPLEIVKNGKSDYCISVNPESPSCVRHAADDLREYIAKATGAELPVVGRVPEDKPAFLLGFLPVKKPETFVVKTVGNRIHISGYDTEGALFEPHLPNGAHTGTWYGVCDFLEKQLGIRWFMPGELGEYVPKRKNWSMEALDYAEAPRMELRIMQGVIPYPQGDTPEKNIRAGQLWLRRNRQGTAEAWSSWHSWRHDFPASKYYRKHPEWFALVKGRRSDEDPGGYGLKMCTTNPGALDQYAANLVASREKMKIPWMLSLTPNDSDRFCECAACTALDDGVRPDGSRIMTSRIMTYANEVARRVRRKLPEQKFGILAYAFYYEAPATLRLDPSITVMEVLNDTGIGYYDPARRKAHLENLKKWRKKLRKLYYYCTPEGMGGLELPCHQYENIKMLFDNLYAADVSGIQTTNNTGFAASGLNNYLYLKFAWGTPDPEKLFREALRDCYGTHGAPVMKAYTADLEKRMAAFALARPDEDIALGYIKRYPTIYTKVYQGLSEAWSRKLNDAIRKTADPGQKARLQIIADNLAYCKITVDFYRIGRSLLASRNPAPAQAALADKLAAQREAILLKQANPPANIFCKLRSKRNLQFFHLLDRKALQYLMTAQTRRHIKAERCAAPPVLDGKLNEKFWEALPSQRIEKNANAETVKVGADVRIAVVNNDLYIGIHCEEPLMEKIADRKRDPESAVWQENCIDLFFAPPNRHNHYYQLIFNSLGTMRTFHYTPESGPWNANAEVRTFRGKNFWSAEVRIPFASMTDKAELRGDIWGINFCRARRTVVPAELTCWSPTFGSFQQPERFGKLIIK